MRIALVVTCAAMTLAAPAAARQPDASRASAVTVTVLSTMLVGEPEHGIGEWGFAALLESDRRRLLVDTGARPDTVLRNAQELGIDLSTVSDVVLTHNHGDHVGGLVALRQALAAKNPAALQRAHVSPQIFDARLDEHGQDWNGLAKLKAAFEAAGGRFVIHATPAELLPGVLFTGPVPRPYPEKNWSGNLKVQSAAGLVDDTLAEDASVVVDTAQGLVVITGCGHAGVVNITEYARRLRGQAPIYALIGGLHLFAATDEQLAWTASKLKAFGVAHLLGAHCTGVEAVFRLRDQLGLPRQAAVVGAVGARFTLGKGIDPTILAR